MKLPSFKKGLHVAVMALMVFYFSGFMPIISVSEAQASANTTSVTVDGSSSTTVIPGTSITVAMTVNGTGSGSNNDWRSSKYLIEGGSWSSCIPTPGHSSGTNTESFNITAPAVNGTYDLSVRAYNSSNCGSGAGSDFTLNNAIIVQTPQPHLLITNATVDGNASTTVLPNASVSLKTYVTTWAPSGGENNDWESTAYKIGDGSWQCNNHEPDPDTNGNYNKTWNITAPNTDGVYNLQVRAYNNDTCNSTIKSDIYTLSNAITVETPAICGDGNIDTNLGEQCDDENSVDVDSCNNKCQANFCDDGIVNNGEICDEGDVNGQAGHCNQSCTDYVPNPAKIDAYKIICPAETNLPDWGVNDNIKPTGTPSSITDWVESGDIYSWVEENECEFARDWDFEWAYDPAANPEDGDNDYNNTNASWGTFNVNSPLELTNLGNGKIWVREAVDPSYIPFSSTLNPTAPQTSAEMYCDSDILNYDNYEWISGLEYGQTYNCVAFNAPVTHDIYGYKFIDAYDDNVIDIGDVRGGAGWTFELKQNDQVIATATTIDDDPATGEDESGKYRFANVSNGTYQICENLANHPGYAQVYPANNGCREVTLTTQTPATYEPHQSFLNEELSTTGSLTICKYNQYQAPLHWNMTVVDQDGDDTGRHGTLPQTVKQDVSHLKEWILGHIRSVKNKFQDGNNSPLTATVPGERTKLL